MREQKQALFYKIGRNKLLFWKKLFSLCSEGAYAYSSTKSQADGAGRILKKLISGKKEVPIEEFMQMYDTRVYNFSSKRNDIKIMKENDFEGVYIIHNVSGSRYYIGKASRILRKIDRQFRGYENLNIYREWKEENKFCLKIVPLSNSGYDNLDILMRDVQKAYEENTSDSVVRV